MFVLVVIYLSASGVELGRQEAKPASLEQCLDWAHKTRKDLEPYRHNGFKINGVEFSGVELNCVGGVE